MDVKTFERNIKTIFEKRSSLFLMTIDESCLTERRNLTCDIEADQVRKIGFQYAPDLASAFERADQHYTEPQVHVVPSGGVILPVIHH